MTNDRHRKKALREVDTFTLRISTNENNRLRQYAETMCISQNALILMFIRYGLTKMENITPFQIEELHQLLSQSQK